MVLISSTARFQANKIVFHEVILQELLDFKGEGEIGNCDRIVH